MDQITQAFATLLVAVITAATPIITLFAVNFLRKAAENRGIDIQLKAISGYDDALEKSATAAVVGLGDHLIGKNLSDKSVQRTIVNSAVNLMETNFRERADAVGADSRAIATAMTRVIPDVLTHLAASPATPFNGVQ